MRLLTDKNMSTISSLTATSAAAEFPVANLLKYPYSLIWKAASFAAAVRITADLGSAKPVDEIWINGANFLDVTIQANSSNSWTAPAVSIPVTLAADDIGIVKGFFNLSAVPYRYVSILIPVQALLNGTLPQLSNVIIGKSVYLYASTWEPAVKEDANTWEPDGGGYVEQSKGRGRHIFGSSMLGITKAEYDAAPVLNGWEVGVVYTQLGGNVADSFLVYRPRARKPRVYSPIKVDFDYTLQELV